MLTLFLFFFFFVFSLGETPLHYAIRSSSIKLVRLLMENGADPTIKAEDGSTPVDVAEQYQLSDILDCLQCNFKSMYCLFKLKLIFFCKKQLLKKKLNVKIQITWFHLLFQLLVV